MRRRGPAEYHDPGNSSNETSVARHAARYTQAMKAMRLRQGLWRGCIVDAACGSGYGTEMLSREFRNSEVVGVDRNHTAIRKARESHPLVEFITLDLSGARTWLKVFRPVHAVVSIETLEHLDGPGAQRKWIAAVSSVLEEGGLFWLACPVRDEPGPSIANPFHLWEPSESGVISMLEWAGLNVIMQESEEYHSTAGEVACQLAILAQKA